MTNGKATLDGDGRTWSEIAAERRNTANEAAASEQEMSDVAV